MHFSCEWLGTLSFNSTVLRLSAVSLTKVRRIWVFLCVHIFKYILISTVMSIPYKE